MRPPGRYDDNYEKQGRDYPVGFVRWTAQRNFETILDMMAQKQLDVTPFITQEFKLAEAEKAYEILISKTSSLGIILQYTNSTVQVEGSTPKIHTSENQLPEQINPQPSGQTKIVLGCIGAGLHANRNIFPFLKSSSARLKILATQDGASCSHAGKKFGFEQWTTNTDEIFDDNEINAVIIATPHNTHLTFIEQSLKTGKHVYVEKPMVINKEQLTAVKAVYEETRNEKRQPLLMVGFNRRFAPHTKQIKQILDASSAPKTFIYTANAGILPTDHWLLNPKIGGGRIISECCHFIDLIRYLAGASIEKINLHPIPEPGRPENPVNQGIITLSFQNGCAGTINYLTNGAPNYPKETLQIFWDGKVLSLDNFKTLKGHKTPGFNNMNLWQQDKGNGKSIEVFLAAAGSGNLSPTSWDEVYEIHDALLNL